MQIYFWLVWELGIAGVGEGMWQVGLASLLIFDNGCLEGGTLNVVPSDRGQALWKFLRGCVGGTVTTFENSRNFRVDQ
jgi:hypothetical protein